MNVPLISDSTENLRQSGSVRVTCRYQPEEDVLFPSWEYHRMRMSPYFPSIDAASSSQEIESESVQAFASRATGGRSPERRTSEEENRILETIKC